MERSAERRGSGDAQRGGGVGLGAARGPGPGRGDPGTGLRGRRHRAPRVDCAVSGRSGPGQRAAACRRTLHRNPGGGDAADEHVGAGGAHRYRPPSGVRPVTAGAPARRHRSGPGGPRASGEPASRLRRTGGSLALLEKGLWQLSGSPLLSYLYGSLLLETGDPEDKPRIEEAKRVLQKALELNPVFANTWYRLARLYLNQGEEQKALEHFERAVALNPKNAEAMYQLSALLTRRGEKERA